MDQKWKVSPFVNSCTSITYLLVSLAFPMVYLAPIIPVGREDGRFRTRYTDHN